MFSYVDSYGTQIWFLLESGTSQIDLDIKDYDNNSLLEYTFEVVNKYNLKQFPFTIYLEDLVPNMEYIVSVFVDGIFVKEMDLFTKRPHLDDMQFLLGSNQGLPSTKIFNHMKDSKSDFMVWLGGHVSFSGDCVNAELSNVGDMLNSYISVRKRSALNEFMSSTPQIATWGSSDYGALSDSPWALKDSSHFVFDLFWPNSLKKTYNYTYFNYGTYQRYNYNDVDLFLLDSRTFVSDSTLYGDTQIDRLFQEIKNTGSTFTIIASPVPFIFDTDDSFSNYQKEFNYFLEKLSVAKIDGLMLLSTSCIGEGQADNKKVEQPFTKMHGYALNKRSYNKTNNIYEFNFPPLSSNTYSLINISGKQGDRIFSFETYNEKGNLIYRKKLHQNDLKSN